MTGDEGLQRHVPVLLEEVLEGMGVRQGGVYLDGTIGWGGHSFQILSRYTDTRVIGLDRDREAVKTASERLAGFGGRVRILHGNFRTLDQILDDMGIAQVDGILLDCGVSSLQLEDAGRGFSFLHDGPLDMRMDKTSKGMTAREIVNTWSKEDLARLFFRYGEERRSRAIAAAIAKERENGPLETTHQLAEVVRSVPGMGKVRKIHPATRTFQALRIGVNDELEAIGQAIPLGVERLVPGGRFAVISFHSLEDRIVKRAFKDLENPCQCPKEYPQCRCGQTSAGRVITRRPIVPTDDEIRNNPRSRSAKLRIFEKDRTQDAGHRTQGQ